jgi:hypothetical protein
MQKNKKALIHIQFPYPVGNHSEHHNLKNRHPNLALQLDQLQELVVQLKRMISQLHLQLFKQLSRLIWPLCFPVHVYQQWRMYVPHANNLSSQMEEQISALRRSPILHKHSSVMGYVEGQSYSHTLDTHLLSYIVLSHHLT